MAEVMEFARAELGAAKQTVNAQGLTIDRLEHRLARLLRVQFGRSSEKMDIAQLHLMFEEIDAPAPANDDTTMASDAKPARKAGTTAPIPAHIPRQTMQHLPEPCGCGGNETVICEDVSEVLDYVPAWSRVLRHVRPRIACRSCETIRQAPAASSGRLQASRFVSGCALNSVGYLGTAPVIRTVPRRENLAREN